MEKKKRIEKFYLDLRAKNNLDQCPFLLEWFKFKFEELANLPDEHDRSGIAKGDRLPVPKTKRILALHDVVFKKLPLKEFCELKGINHGTGRNWRNTDKIFSELALGFAEEYSHAFLRRYSELIESERAEGILKASQLINECRHYPAVTVGQIMIRLERYDKQENTGPVSIDTLTALKRFHHILFSILLFYLKGKEGDRREDAQTLMDQRLKDIDDLYEKLRAKYKGSEAQAALDFAEKHAYQSFTYYAIILQEFID